MAPSRCGACSAGAGRALRGGRGAQPRRAGPLALTARAGRTAPFFEDFRNWDRIPEFERVVAVSALAESPAELMGSGEVRLFHDHVLVKEAGLARAQPVAPGPALLLHRRHAERLVLDPARPVTRASTLEFVAGSHAAGTWFMPRTFVTRPRWSSTRARSRRSPTSTPTATPSPNRRLADRARDAAPSTCSRSTPPPARRPAGGHSPSALIGDDVTYAPRPHRTSPPFHGASTAAPARATPSTTALPRPLARGA